MYETLVNWLTIASMVAGPALQGFCELALISASIIAPIAIMIFAVYLLFKLVD